MDEIISKIKLSKKNTNEKMKPLVVSHDSHPSLQRIIEAFENSDKVTLGYSTLEKDGEMTKPSLKKKLLYLTGASLRDHLFNETFKKYELVTNATPEEIRMILNFFKFTEIKPYNEKYLNKYEKVEKTSVNPFKYYVDKWDSHGNEMGFNVIVKNQDLELNTLDKNPKFLLKEPNLRKFTTSIHEDALSRDFTVNAIYLKLKNSEGENTELYDPVRGVHDIIHNQIYLIGNDDSKFKENPDLMFKLVELSTKFSNDNKVSEGNIKNIKDNIQDTEDKPKLFKKNYMSSVNNEDISTFNYLKNLYITGLFFKLFPNLKITPPIYSLFNDYIFVTAFILQNNHEGLLFKNLTNLHWNKFEIQEIIFIKKLIDWSKTEDESLIKNMLGQLTDIPVQKMLHLMKILNKEKEFKKILEKYSSDII